MVYLSKVNLMVGTPRGEEQRRSNEAKLKQAEHKFGQAIFLSNNCFSWQYCANLKGLNQSIFLE
jgi:hypothetical protein